MGGDWRRVWRGNSPSEATGTGAWVCEELRGFCWFGEWGEREIAKCSLGPGHQGLGRHAEELQRRHFLNIVAGLWSPSALPGQH